MAVFRFLLRLIVSLLLVLGVGVAFAWAWDHSEPASATPPALPSGSAQH